MTVKTFLLPVSERMSPFAGKFDTHT